MATSFSTPHAPPLGAEGELCAACGAPLAADQRYCLECGARRADPRVAFRDALGGAGVGERPPESGPAPAGAAGSGPREMSPGTAALGVVLAVLFLGVGVLVGRSGTDSPKTAAAPAVVTVGGGGGAGANASAATAEFQSDWPAKETGWTVQLQALPKESSDAAKVAAAKQAASGKGAPDVGALDSDEFGSLPPDQYVVYSGRFKTKGEATKALGKVRKSFPKAKVVRVAASGAAPVIDSAQAKAAKQELQQLQNLSGSEYSKRARKLPKTLPLPGRAPPKDNKKAGGGSGFDTIE